MAHVVGVPKREPCQKCAMPVFLAERLTVGKHVYHRTCLRCARCSSQLTPGSFYETETDGEFCCETCPDEEEQTEDDVENANFANSALSTPGSRSSIANRLAFFESVQKSDIDQKLLQKSVSDEEKSKSLKKLNESSASTLSSTSVPYKMNSALSNFMNNTIGAVADATDSVDDDDSEMTDLEPSPPELPKSQPPKEAETFVSSSTFVVKAKQQTPPPPANDALKLSEETKDDKKESLEKEDDNDENKVDMKMRPKIEEDIETTTRLSVVRARLYQFEEVITTNSNSDKQEIEDFQKSPQKEVPTDKLESDSRGLVQDDKGEIVKTEVINEKSSSNIETLKDMKETDEEICENIEKVEDIVKSDDVKSSKSVDILGITEKEETVPEISENKNEISKILQDNVSMESSYVVPELSPDYKETNDISIVVESEKTEVESHSIVVETDLKNPETLENLARNSEILEKESEKPIITEKIDVKEDTTESQQNMEQQSEKFEEKTENIPEISITVTDESLDTPQNSLDTPPTTPEDHISTALSDVKAEEVENLTLDVQSPAENQYPDDLNPFGSDEEEQAKTKSSETPKKPSVIPRKLSNTSTPMNPFDSSDDEVELEKIKFKPPRPPPPRISKNPFGSESDNDDDESSAKGSSQNVSTSNLNTSSVVRTPVPAPRLSASKNPTPEATPRLSDKKFNTSTPLDNSNSFYGSCASLGNSLSRDSEVRGSNYSLSSSIGTIRSRKTRRAPLPPAPVKELFPSTETLSTPSSSNSTTPHQPRKKRPAPLPPTPSSTGSKNLYSCPSETNIGKLSDEEKALLEGKDQGNGRRLIALDMRIIEDADASDDIRRKEEENVVYRRKIVPLDVGSPVGDADDFTHDRQLEKLKDNKEANNRNRQSQLSFGNGSDDNESFLNKSSHGKWKRRKGPAPLLPVPPRKILQMLPLQEIRHELDIIEVQQQGLEKQGVILEKMIRERCEVNKGELETADAKTSPNTKEVEDLILQLFELVNEKNELFRRQAELMYLRRQHRLEQEQADLEYEIRVLMAQPERNKTDSDKAREESLIARMVEVVQLRNEVIECLEMDRLREAEEDMSIKYHLDIHSAKREETESYSSEKETSQTKLSKKERKKQKEMKKLGKSKKLDADKDADESELDLDKLKLKKKKKKFLFLKSNDEN